MAMTEVEAVDLSEWVVAREGEAETAEFGGAQLAGRTMLGSATGELLTSGAAAMLVRLDLKAGFDQDGHEHPDHESIGYVVSGELEMTVGGNSMTLRAGDTWYHPKGVFHTCRAVVDSIALEFHAPLRPDVLKLFGR
jgi:quercetin dioxygenase-like cupin family protein